MHRFLLLALPLALSTACSEQHLFTKNDNPNAVAPGSIRGRVCDPSGRTWLPDAQAYTYLYDENNMIYDTRMAYTDRDGYWLLDELPGEAFYEIWIQYGYDFLGKEEVWLSAGQEMELEQPACFDPLQMDVAVITGDYDDFQLVLQDMGFANYELIDGLVAVEMKDFLMDLPSMQFYDIIFFNGGHVEEDVIVDTNDSLVPNGDGFTDDEIIRANIRSYVDGGGALYASDWAYDVVEQVWPDAINFVGDDGTPDDAQTGEYQTVNAAVSDASLGSFLGSNYISVVYDLPVWPPIENVDGLVSIHLTASVDYRLGRTPYTLPSSPILVSFGSGSGKVAFSTFRVARNATSDIMATLQYMMYRL
jgi:hypothetical protein